MKKITWCSALVAGLLLVGCGDDGSSEETENITTTSSPSALVVPETTPSASDESSVLQKGIGYYVDEAVEGVSYVCGEYEGNTTKEGAFEFEKGEECTFSLAGIKLREINGSILMEDNLTILEDNESVARMLQSFDVDGNASNGIQLNAKALQEVLEENHVDHVVEDESLLQMVVEELKVKDENFTGDVVSEEEVQVHLEQTKEHLIQEGRITQYDLNESTPVAQLAELSEEEHLSIGEDVVTHLEEQEDDVVDTVIKEVEEESFDHDLEHEESLDTPQVDTALASTTEDVTDALENSMEEATDTQEHDALESPLTDAIPTETTSETTENPLAVDSVVESSVVETTTATEEDTPAVANNTPEEEAIDTTEHDEVEGTPTDFTVH